MSGLNGLVKLVPTSIQATGGTGSTSAAGTVTFTAVDNIGVHGVFSSTYVAYWVTVSSSIATSAEVTLRLCASQVDDQTASSYISQIINASGTTATAARTTGVAPRISTFGTTGNNLLDIYFFNPGTSATKTAVWALTNSPASSQTLEEASIIHTVASAFDGFRLVSTQKLTGTLSVFGMVR